MAPSPTHYLAVLRASYDYEPQSNDEIAIKEDQILLLLERTDEDWWKVKVKDSSEEDKSGLVPAAYVEPAPHKSVVKALYPYEASAPGEVTITEDEVLQGFEVEDDWLLVQTESGGGKAGFVPASYVEEMDGDGPESSTAAPALSAHQIVVPPPRPSNYIDPAERVAAANASKAVSDSIETWSVSEVDKKGKKKKGTLGVGNGAVFFASEADKAPVQKWQISDVNSWRVEKSKHVHVEIDGSAPASLHLHAGTKDTAEAITSKLQSSKGLSSPPKSQAPLRASVESAGEDESDEADAPKTTPKRNGVNVHFSTAPPSIISPREPSEDGDRDYDLPSTKHGEGAPAIALYDFTADGEDELSVRENEVLVVLERDGDDWWKCCNAQGKEGVVPASYIELIEGGAESSNGASHADVSDEEERAAREAEEERLRSEKEEEDRRRKEREQERERQRKKAEAERQAKAAAEAAEAERERKSREAKEKERKADELARAELERKSRQSRPASSSAHASSSRGKSTDHSPSPSRAKDTNGSSKSRVSSDAKPRGLPSPQRTRLWHDKSGQYKVEAEFLGFSNGKLRLHKVNGVVIEVPLERMSPEDVKYIEKVTGKRSSPQPNITGATSDDDQPLAVRRKSLQPEPKAPSKPPLPKKGPSIDWFEFFLNAGCDVDDCTRYANAFERDKIDETILTDITEQIMRSLGLREGDIIRVKKAIAQRQPTQREIAQEAQTAQMKADEELARRLQAEESGLVPKRSSVSPAPNLFSAGPGGALRNNTRRGRPQPSKSSLPANVDLDAIATASQQISRGGSPVVTLTTSPTSVTAPPRTSSAPISGFDDDAWTNRPSSTKPTPSPAAAPTETSRAPSAPPAQTSPLAQTASVPTTLPPSHAPDPVQTAPALPPASATTASSPHLAQTTESDVMKQLERLANLRTQSPAVTGTPQASSLNVTPVISSPPVSFQNGLGMGSSPLPLGHLQTQATSFTPPIGPRGPFAPVPSNQGLLQPLIPTTTGFNSFVSTRPHSSPLPQQQMQMQSPPPPPVPPIPIQPTGFPMGMQPQATGFLTMAPMMTQATGFPPVGMGMQQSPFANPTSFGGLQPQPTGFNAGFGQFQAPSPPPPVPPLPSNSTNSTSPANIFAAMKSGTFGNDSAPQSGDKYDVLRPQPTGWGVQPGAGYPNGFSGVRY